MTDDQWYEEAREICLKRLDRRANTRGELADILDSKGVPEPVREAVLDRLTEVGLIDDADSVSYTHLTLPTRELV